MKMSESEYLAIQARMDASKRQPAEAKPKPLSGGAKLEGPLHDEIEAFLKSRGFYYVHSRMDKPTTTALGVPDFVISIPGLAETAYMDEQPGKTLWVEVKSETGKLTDEQIHVRAYLCRDRQPYCVVRSMAEFMDFFNRETL